MSAILETLFFDFDSGVLYKVRSDDSFWFIYSVVISGTKMYLHYDAKYPYKDFDYVKDVLRYHIGQAE